MARTEIDAADVLQRYLSLFAGGAGIIRSERELGYPKVIVKQVLVHCLSLTKDEQTRKQLELAFVSLADFQVLNESEEQAVRLVEDSKEPGSLSDQELTTLAKEMTRVGNAYADVQQRVLSEQQSLMEELRALGA